MAAVATAPWKETLLRRKTQSMDLPRTHLTWENDVISSFKSAASERRNVGNELALANNYHYLHYIPPVIILSLIAFNRDWFCVIRILNLNRKPHGLSSSY